MHTDQPLAFSGEYSAEDFNLAQPVDYWDAEIEPISEAVSSRAMYLVESYSLSDGLQMADALIAATAVTLGQTLVTANDKHYRFIDDLEIEVFRP